MLIIKPGDQAKAEEYDSIFDKRVRFVCDRCGCEYVASLLHGDIYNTFSAFSMNPEEEAWADMYESHCPECDHENQSKEVVR